MQAGDPKAAPYNSFNRSGNSVPFIENWMLLGNTSRPVISGVRRLEASQGTYVATLLRIPHARCLILCAACAGLMLLSALGMLYFPAKAGFQLNPHPCQLTFVSHLLSIL